MQETMFAYAKNISSKLLFDASDGACPFGCGDWAARVSLRQPADLQGSDCQGLRSIIADKVRIVATGAK
jgi:hypothetical protein